MERVLVIGAARSGLAVARLLTKHNYRVTISDQKKIPEKEELKNLGIEVLDEGHPEELFDVAWKFIVKNPGIPYRAPIVKRFVEKGYFIYTEIEIAYRYAKNFEYGAITGTNGKTTITTLLYEMLKTSFEAKFAGNIGIPLSELVLEDEEISCKVVLELSNFQLLGVDSFRAKVSTICNLAPDHLDYMNTLEEYYLSKAKIYENTKPSDIFLRNIDDELVMKYAKDIPCTVVDVSLKNIDADVTIKEDKILYQDTILFNKSDVRLAGDYNLMNAMFAGSMAYILGVQPKEIQKALNDFHPVEHRLEYVGEKDGVKIYNDSKATNPHATQAALSSFQHIILLAGGHEKGIPFDSLKKYDANVKYCIGYGETKEKVTAVFTNHKTVETMFEAFDEAIKLCEKGDVILLSPACSSYDQFINYEERGRLFKEYVNAHLKEKR